MPQTFTPKFVDLVRNVTTVQGTGPAAPGAAMQAVDIVARDLAGDDAGVVRLESVGG